MKTKLLFVFLGCDLVPGLGVRIPFRTADSTSLSSEPGREEEEVVLKNVVCWAAVGE